MTDAMPEHIEVYAEDESGESYGYRHWVSWKYVDGCKGFASRAAAETFASEAFPDLPVEHSR